jgi:hypothetical protein
VLRAMTAPHSAAAPTPNRARSVVSTGRSWRAVAGRLSPASSQSAMACLTGSPPTAETT